MEIDMDSKSALSLDAGNKLVADKLYTQSVHCFYYSVLQMMMYRLTQCKDNAFSYEDSASEYSPVLSYTLPMLL